MVLTATGFVPIEANADEVGAKSTEGGTPSTEAQTVPAVAKRLLVKDYDPDQPRVSPGQPGAGRWSSGDGAGSSSDSSASSNSTGSGSSPEYAALDTGTPTDATTGESNIQVAAGPGRAGYPIDLLEEEAQGGHAIRDHVGKSQDYLLSIVNDTAARAESLGDLASGLREGSFPSLEAANKLVNSTISANQNEVDLVVDGLSQRAEIDEYFGSPTGYEAFAQTERSTAFVRDTYGVHVVIVRDLDSPKGYQVLTAYPINR